MRLLPKNLLLKLLKCFKKFWTTKVICPTIFGLILVASSQQRRQLRLILLGFYKAMI